MTEEMIIRASSVGQSIECPYQFYEQHILGTPRPGTLALSLGTIYHAMVEYSLLEKNNLQDKQFGIDLFVQKKCIENGVDYLKMCDDSPKEIEMISQLALEFDSAWLHKIDPAFTEKELKLDLSGTLGLPITITGHVDLVTRNNVIIDHKTARQRFKIEHKVGYQLQMTCYYLLAKAAELAPVRETYFLVAVKPKCEIYREKFTVTDDHITYLYNILENIYMKWKLSTPRLNLFEARRTHQYCAKRWCPYVDSCEKAWGGRVKD